MAGKNKERSLNPVLAMRKNQRKKEIKKTKQNRIQQRTATLKQKDVHELITEMENLDRLELESIRKGYFNENTLREKKYKLRQTIIQMEKENKAKAKEIKSLLSNYDLRKNSNLNTEGAITISEDDKNILEKDEIKKMLPNIPLPISNITLPSTTLTNKEQDKPIDLNDIKFPAVSETSNETFPPVAWLPAHLNPPLPPPCIPPADAPALPDYLKNTIYHGPILNVYFPPSHTTDTINNPLKLPATIVQTRKITPEIDSNINYTAESTLCAKPVLKDLQAEVTKLVPTTLQVKRNKSTITPTPNNNNVPQKKEKILENFMREINDLP